MLSYLLIKNYALIQRLEMRPSSALNIITGETGAGKSIMLGAVGLLLGNRADTKALFSEAEKCVIEGEFDIGAYTLQAFFEDEGLDYEQHTTLRREISPTGKSRAFINDTPVTLDVIRTLGNHLMDVHSQHDTLQLGEYAFQLKLIDAYANNTAVKEAYRVKYNAFRKAKNVYDSLIKEADGIRKEAEFNTFMLEELVKAKLQGVEQEQLEEEVKLLENAEDIKLKLNHMLGLLTTSDFPIDSGLQEVGQALRQMSQYADKYEKLFDRVDNLYFEVRDIVNDLEKEETNLEYDPEKTQAAKDRLSLVYQLQQKHQVGSVKELLEIQASLQQKVDKAQNLDDAIAEAQGHVNSAEEAMAKKATQLRKTREGVLRKIEKEITKLLHTVGMPDATLSIKRNDVVPGPEGTDEIQILFSANKGVKPEQLKHVASGGEFSRLMFCVKYVLADKTAMPTIVFDEIDTGISGEIALKMGKMMQEMAENHQVVSISHLPQIAAKGNAHYFVYKDNTSDKAVSKIRPLEGQERVEAIARMIGGDQPSATAFENAKELIGM